MSMDVTKTRRAFRDEIPENPELNREFFTDSNRIT